VVPAAGLEPARPTKPRDFKSLVSTIPPRGRILNVLYSLNFLVSVMTASLQSCLLSVYRIKQETMTTLYNKITQQTAGSIKPTGSIYFVRDTELKGFAIKVTAKGQASFVVDLRIKHGGTLRHTIGGVDHILVKDARVKAHEMIALAKHGIDPRYQQPNKPLETQTLGWCLEQHINTNDIAESTKRTYRNQINNAFGDWLRQPVENITPDRIVERRLKLRESKSDNYVNACLRALKAVLNKSDLTANPVTIAAKKRNFSVQSTATEYEEFLRIDAIVALLHNYRDSSNFIEAYIDDGNNSDIYLGNRPEPNIFAACLYLMLIGGREQDVYNLTWDMVDHANGIISYPPRSRKDKKRHNIPMIGMINDLIMEQPKHRRHPNLVFGMSHEMFRHRYNRSIRPITGHTSKSLRKTFAEHMGLDRYDSTDVGIALNHSQALSGTVTSKHYQSGALIRERQLREIFLAFQMRCVHYAMGYSYDDDVRSDILGDAGIGDKPINLNEIPDKAMIATFLSATFPTFCKLLKDRTSPETLDAFEGLEEVLHLVSA